MTIISLQGYMSDTRRVLKKRRHMVS